MNVILYIYSIYIHNLIHMHKHYFSVWITHCIPLGCQLLMTQHHLYREMLLGRCIKEGEGESHGHCATSEWPCSTSKTSTGGGKHEETWPTFQHLFFLWRVSEMLIRTQVNLEAKLIDMACSSAAKARATHGLDHVSYVSCFASYLSCHFTNFSLTVLFLCSFLWIVILGLNSQAQVWIALRQLRDIWLRLCRVWWLLLVNGLVSSFGLQDVLNTGLPLPPAATCSNIIQEVIFHHPRMVLVSRFETPQLAVWSTQYSFTHTHTHTICSSFWGVWKFHVVLTRVHLI